MLLWCLRRQRPTQVLESFPLRRMCVQQLHLWHLNRPQSSKCTGTRPSESAVLCVVLLTVIVSPSASEAVAVNVTCRGTTPDDTEAAADFSTAG